MKSLIAQAGNQLDGFRDAVAKIREHRKQLEKNMPYIKKQDRKRFDAVLGDLETMTQEISAGELNYLLSSVIWRIFKNNKGYSKANELMGVLECVKQEFYLRMVTPYEKEKQEENGDILE